MLLLALFAVSFAWSVIPRPQQISFPGGSVSVCSSSLSISGAGGPILQAGIARFFDTVFKQSTTKPPSSCPGSLSISIQLSSQSETLNSDTLENYTLSIGSGSGSIAAASTFGALHALETLAQLVDRSQGSTWTLPIVSVVDFPRFSFRGFLHDTARHFLPLSTIYKLLDALSSAKYNVFHWHIVDDQSFPYVSQALPKLSLGSYGGKTSMTYSPQDVQNVITYAKYRGIRVIPEFDTPGHCASWGVGYPEVVTDCYTNGKPNGLTGPLNPTLNSTFDLLTSLWNEIASVFPDDYAHLGGDEVSFDCWRSNPSIQAWMAARGWTDYDLLEQFYEQRLIPIVAATGKKYIVWQEIFDNGLKIDPHTIVDVWIDSPWKDELARVTKAGYSAILSAPWYLNYIGNPYNENDACKAKGNFYGEGDWCQYYLVEPLNFTASEEQKKRVIGGEGCMWAEYSSPANVVSNTWPKAAVVGERLWSSADTRDLADIAYRLPTFTCELNRRSIEAAPVTGPGYCDWQ